MKFRPRARAGKYDWFIVCGIATALFGSVFFLRKYPGHLTAAMIIIPLLLVFLYYYYLVMSVRKMMYTVQNNGIRIKYGFMNLLLPYEDIVNVEIVRRSNWKKLFGTAWRSYFAGYFLEKKMGLVRVYGTVNQDAVYIRTKEGRFAITPANNQLFFEELNLRWEKPALRKEDVLYAERTEKKRVWQDPATLVTGIVGIASGIAQAALAIYVWVSGIHISLLSYSLTGGETSHSTYPEIMFFPLVTLYFAVRLLLAADLLLRHGGKMNARSLMVNLIITLGLLALMLVIVFENLA